MKIFSFSYQGITGNSSTILQYSMNLRNGPKDPYLYSLPFKVQITFMCTLTSPASRYYLMPQCLTQSLSFHLISLLHSHYRLVADQLLCIPIDDKLQSNYNQFFFSAGSYFIITTFNYPGLIRQ